MTTEAAILILDLISLIIRMTPIFICLKPRYGQRENIAAASVYLWTLMISMQSLLQIPHHSFVLFQGIFSALFFLILMIFFEGSLMLKAFLYFSAWFFSELLTSLFSFIGYFMRFQSMLSYEDISVILAVMMLIIYFFLVRYYLKERILRLFEQLSGHSGALIMAMPILFLMLLYLGSQTVLPPEKLRSEGLPTQLFYLFFCSFMFIFYLIAVSDTLHTIDHRSAEEQLAAARQIVSLKRKNYMQLQQYQQRIRIIEHDFSHHLHALEHMGEKERTEYLKQLGSELGRNKEGVFCENEAVNSLLREYKGRAEGCDTAFRVEISISKELPADTLSVCVILGNLLENAVEACSKCGDDTERFISLQMREEPEGLRIMIRNSYDGRIRMYKTRLLTTKKDGGLGMLSVRRLLDHPLDDFDYYFDNRVFSSMVFLKRRDNISGNGRGTPASAARNGPALY